MTTAQQLRESARHLRERAQYAERSIDAKDDLNEAAKLEARADVMEGVTREHKTYPEIPTKEEMEQRRRENHKRAFAQLESFFRPKK